MIKYEKCIFNIFMVMVLALILVKTMEETEGFSSE